MSTAKTTSAEVCSTAAAAVSAAESVPDHDYTDSFITDRQSPELSPLPESDPDTPTKPDGKKLKGDLTLTELQSNNASLINEYANNLESTINTICIDTLKKSIDFVFTLKP